MKIYPLDSRFAGNWHRDCELLSLKLNPSPLEITYRRESDSTFWKLQIDSLISLKVLTEELSVIGYLSKLPDNGSFYELTQSPWFEELRETNVHFVKKARHFVFCFYDEVIEVIAPDFTIKQLMNQE